MIEQINFSIVIIFAGIVVGSALVLLFATPGAVKEYKQKLAIDKKQGKHTSNESRTASTIDIGLTIYMEELSRCSNRDKIKKLKQDIARIISETEFKSTSQIHLHRVDSVKKWLKKFSIDQHIKDLKTTKVSQQIQFDKKKKDFKLMIIK